MFWQKLIFLRLGIEVVWSMPWWNGRWWWRRWWWVVSTLIVIIFEVNTPKKAFHDLVLDTPYEENKYHYTYICSISCCLVGGFPWLTEFAEAWFWVVVAIAARSQEGLKLRNKDEGRTWRRTNQKDGGIGAREVEEEARRIPISNLNYIFGGVKYKALVSFKMSHRFR